MTSPPVADNVSKVTATPGIACQVGDPRRRQSPSLTSL